ncbi:MAG: ABC transporter permease [Thiohalomonadaceae bacterium]
MIFSIAAHELRSLFLSPLAWVILAVVQFILAWIFLAQLDLYLGVQAQLANLEHPPGITELLISPLFSSAALLLLLVIPLLSMRLISEERRARTLPLLLSAPVSLGEIVLGKYLGLLTFLGLMLLLVLLMPLSLLGAGSLDYGLLGANLLGLALMIAAFAAASLYISALTSQPTIAAIGSFGLLLLLWIIDWSGQNSGGSVLAWLSLQQHYQGMLQGLFDTADVAYYLLFITTFIVLAVRRMDAERLQD